MITNVKSIRPFIGSKDFKISKEFYHLIGFKGHELDKGMSLFILDENFSFYLQDYYVKEWIENTMVFVELTNIEKTQDFILSLELDKRFDGVRIRSNIHFEHGMELHLIDPAGVCWHFCEFGPN